MYPIVMMAMNHFTHLANSSMRVTWLGLLTLERFGPSNLGKIQFATLFLSLLARLPVSVRTLWRRSGGAWWQVFRKTASQFVRMCRQKIELDAAFGKRGSPLWQTPFYRLKWNHGLVRRFRQNFLQRKHGLFRCQTRAGFGTTCKRCSH